MSNDFKLPRELGLLASQMYEQQHYDAAGLVVARLNASLEDLEKAIHDEISELKAKLADAESKIPKVIDGTDLAVNCSAEASVEVLETAATADVAATEIKPA